MQTLQTGAAVKHPAKFSEPIKDVIVHAFQRFDCGGPIYDPFAGVGGVHDIAARLGITSYGVELEPEWAQSYVPQIGRMGEVHATLVGSALQERRWGSPFGTVITSPCYGNRMADHHNAQDGSKRHTYTHTLGHALHAENSGQLQWGDEYKRFHQLAWCRLEDTGARHLILNVSDHIRAGKVVQVCQWHVDCLRDLGWVERGSFPVETQRQRYGANADLRVPCEMVYVLERSV